MDKKYDLIVIGSGAAGLTVAIGGIKIGANVLLVEKENKLGGDCTHYGCVPSKSLIGLSKTHSNIEDILNKVRDTVKFVENKSENINKIKEMGIDLEFGNASFKDKNTIIVNNTEFVGKNIIIAAGSSAYVPEIKGIDKIKYLTNRSIFDVKNIKSLSIIGAGPIGSELGQAFNRIGVKVNLIQKGQQILGREDIDAAKFIEKQFIDEGINLFTGVDIVEVKENKSQKIVIVKQKNGNVIEISSDEILVATGRAPNLSGLNLDEIGIKYDNRGIFIDSRCRTNIKNIYAIGDIARGPQFTHFANYQGKIVLANTLFKFPQQYSDKIVPRVTFTTPEVASIGIMDGILLKKEYSDIDRGITDNETGFIKIYVDNKGYVNGAVIVGKGAGEMIHEIAILMQNKLKITAISNTIHAYPTYSYGLRECADLFRSLSYSETKKKWVKRIFGFGKN